MTIPAPPYPDAHDLLAGRSVVVTAAAGTGIGFATAKRCLEEGARVVLSDHHERRLEEAADRLADELGGRPSTVVCDVTDEAQVQGLVDGAVVAFGGPIDVMVKKYGDDWYLFAAAARDGKTSGAFIIEGLPSGATVEAIDEGLSEPAAGLAHAFGRGFGCGAR